MEVIGASEERKKNYMDEKAKFLEEIITAAARYERLLALKDFQDLLVDLGKLVALHKSEINSYLEAYSLASSFFKKMRLAEVMAQHQIRMQQIQEAVNYPQVLVQKAVESREELAKLKAMAKENVNV